MARSNVEGSLKDLVVILKFVCLSIINIFLTREPMHEISAIALFEISNIVIALTIRVT